jgi:hypothetical protein
MILIIETPIVRWGAGSGLAKRTIETPIVRWVFKDLN